MTRILLCRLTQLILERGGEEVLALLAGAALATKSAYAVPDDAQHADARPPVFTEDEQGPKWRGVEPSEMHAPK